MIARPKRLDPRTEFDVQAYQRFWSQLDLSVYKKLEGKHVALEQGEAGWHIIESADSLDELIDLLTAAGKDVSSVALDSIHREDETAPGIELQ